MGSTLETVVFYFLAAFIIGNVHHDGDYPTYRTPRLSTCSSCSSAWPASIFFAGLHPFLGSVQIMAYAGGIVVLYVFSILLTSGEGDRAEESKTK